MVLNKLLMRKKKSTILKVTIVINIGPETTMGISAELYVNNDEEDVQDHNEESEWENCTLDLE